MSPRKPRYTPAEALALKVRRQEQAKADARAVREGVAETTALAEARGSEFNRPPLARGEREKPIKRMSGLDWLFSRKLARISFEMKLVGERYGRLWRQAHDETSMRSCIDDSVRGFGQEPAATAVRAAAARVEAQEDLDKLRAAVGYQVHLVEALDLICGQELTPREAASNGRGAAVIECALTVALDLLVQHVNGRRAAA